MAVGRVLEHYDTDKQFPAWGFGAALPPNGGVSHCFALNGNPANPEVAGVQGILEAYRHTLSSVRLSGPTLFAPIINAAAQVSPGRCSRDFYLKCPAPLLLTTPSLLTPPPLLVAPCRLRTSPQPAPSILCC
jgi:hypothetical protein